MKYLKKAWEYSKHKRKAISHSTLGVTVHQFWQGQWWQVLMMSWVFALLLMFLHIFVLASKMTSHASEWIRERLGVYFYIKDGAQVESGVTQEQIWSRVVKFKDELEDGGLKVKYFSKDEALKNLQERLPNMVKNFDEYGIDNPLPVTLYVTFRDQAQYDFIMKAKDNYQDIILSNNQTTNSQEQFIRNARIINVLKVLQFFFAFIIIACVLVILLFLGMIIKTKFTAMQHTIDVQKLLGSPYARLKRPFFINSFVLLTFGYVITVILSFIFLYNLGSIFPYLFGTTLSELLGGALWLRLIWLFVEFILILGVAYVYANYELNKLLKK